MGSAILTAHALQQSPRPQSAYVLGTTNTSSYAASHACRAGSEAGISSSKSEANVSTNSFSMDLEDLDFPSFNTDFELDTSVFTSGKEQRPIDDKEDHLPFFDGTPSAVTFDGNLPKQTSSSRSKRMSLIDRPRSWLVTGSRSTKAMSSSDDSFPTGSSKGASLPHSASSSQLERRLTGSESFATFAKRSWMSRSSRSPSPKNVPDQLLAGQQPKEAAEVVDEKFMDKKIRGPHRLHIITNQDEVDEPKIISNPLNLASSYFSRMKSKRQATFDHPESLDSDNSCASSATSLNRTSESNQTSAPQSICSDSNTNTPTTDGSCNEVMLKSCDPLYSTFRALDIDFVSSKQTTAQRVTQVQTLLLPMLRSTSDHPSTKLISLEDVERRAAVFDRWWTLLLDMLQGQTQQHIPGMDRPVLLEAATMLMMRPEWRQSTSYLQPLADRSTTERVRSRSWTDASKSTMDSPAHFTMMAESAEHNVKTMFISNLVRQMAYVVGKMSLRHAPLHLVSFSGKTCAYAFFFVPGVADVLVRLWGLTPELIRRVGTELGLPRKDRRESDDIVARFPPKLCAFGWSTPRAMWDSLKQIPKMPLPVARIPWTGPWVARWKGRDTDLFFIFSKYFHILSDQFVPPGLPLTEKARSPAFALVHAQLLSIIDSTIHRQMGADQSLTAPLVDSVMSPDAPAVAAMPLPHGNMLMGMAENRLVILLKDFLTDDLAILEGARHTFAQTFAALVKAAARKTSLYDNAACSTLCDFLEETLMIYHEFETPSTSIVDWSFWIDVCKKMSTSLNTMTEVRMLSFVFTVWDAMVRDPCRKTSVCLDWLLSEETFNTFFNNWCPMVRAYYQRLICWRMCRHTGGTDELEMTIFLTAAARLESHWAHYLYLKQDAENKGRAPPSTAPMSPVMGKKFMIIRQEVNTPAKALFAGFDSFARLAPSPALALGSDTPDTSGLARHDSNKKRWSLIGKVLSMTSNSPMQSPSDELPRSPSEASGLHRELSDAPLIRPALTTRQSIVSEDGSLSSPTLIDEPKHIFKFVLGWQQTHGPARDRVLTKPRLPNPTQARISAKGRAIRPRLPSSPHLPRSSAQSPSDSKPLTLQVGDDVNLAAVSIEAWLRNTPATGSACQNEDGPKVVVDSRRRPIGGLQPSVSNMVDVTKDLPTKPVRPTSFYAQNAIYCGRALAEWTQVVSECNIFTERRQDDGIERLCDVEVPLLSVEGYRKFGI